MLRISSRILASKTSCVSARRLGISNSRRSLSDSASGTSSWLTEPLQGIDSVQYVCPSDAEKNTKVTKLSNGLTVASQNKFGVHCTVGVVINAGPRFEAGFPTGVSHFLEKLGFHSTASYASRNDVQAELEKSGAIFDCQIAKDIIIYAISGEADKMPDILNVLSEVVLAPRITEEEVGTAGQSISYELEAMAMTPPPDNILTELLHEAAYGPDQTLGMPRYCPQESIESVTRTDLLNYLATYYRPDRMVLAGVGIPHDEFVACAERSFLQCTPTWQKTENSQFVDNTRQPDTSKALYRGGMTKLERDLSQYHSPMPEFAHLVLGLESCGISDPHFVPACLLNTLMGGGGSFSAGGPGKGMYSRLYLSVLNQYYWVNSAVAGNHAYKETGVFGISASSEPKDLRQLTETIGQAMRNMQRPIPVDELDRAKKQLESMLLMNLEFRAVVFEDIARQVLTHGERRPPEYWVDAIEKVREDDVMELVQRMFQSAPSVVGFGRLDNLPSYEEVLEIFQGTKERSGRPRIFNFFSGQSSQR